MYFIGYDLGSSSLKTALVDSQTGKVLEVVKTPAEELRIDAPQVGWAEQEPEHWWECVCQGTRKILSKTKVAPEKILGIGIAYQMHGLVALDAAGDPVRPSIIWCDSRAVAIGDKTYAELGPEKCRTRLLNEPGNFTASKLRWMQQHEHGVFKKTETFLLPGDYLAYRFSGKRQTTAGGLSEGILWDFKKGEPAYWLLEHWGISKNLIPEIVPTFSEQAKVSEAGARESGLAEGTPILYRAGDQPNNAFTLNVLEPGKIAATGGTSGVLYGVTDNPEVSEMRRFNHFAHVNHSGDHIRIGQLLCINGAGSTYRWLKDQLEVTDYEEMNALAEEVAVGSEGLKCFPFGNGAERMLENKAAHASFTGIEFNRHHKAHLCRAALEGIAFAFRYGMELMEAQGVPFDTIRAGNDNLFQAAIFTDTLTALGQTPIELYRVTGAVGAARACMVQERGLEGTMKLSAKRDYLTTVLPPEKREVYQAVYLEWKTDLENQLKNTPCH